MNPELIFAGTTGAELKAIIVGNDKNYKLVEAWLNTHKNWRSGYWAHRKAQGLPFTNMNATVWSLIECAQGTSDGGGAFGS